MVFIDNFLCLTTILFVVLTKIIEYVYCGIVLYMWLSQVGNHKAAHLKETSKALRC